MYHPLTPDSGARKALLRRVETAVAAHEQEITIGLDGLPSLDATVMGTLIVALRRMREAGGTVVLHVTRPELLSDLSMSGLDRVFKVVAQQPESEPEKKAKRKGSGAARKVAGGLASIFAALLVLGGSHPAIGAMLGGLK